MQFTYKDNAFGLIDSNRSSGGTTLVLQSGGASFGNAMTTDKPMPVTIFDADDNFQTILKCTGRSGNTLTVAGTLGGYADVNIVAGWKCACVPTSVDFDSVWTAVNANTTALATAAHTSDITALDTRLDSLEALPALPNPSTGSGKAVASNGSAYVLIDVVRPTTITIGALVQEGSGIDISGSGTSASPLVISANVDLSSKQDVLPSGSAGQFLANDLTFKTPPIAVLEAGDNVDITGSGTSSDPYLITSTAAGGGGGTVTSVALSVPSGLSVSGTPITTSGTLAITTSLERISRGSSAFCAGRVA